METAIQVPKNYVIVSSKDQKNYSFLPCISLSCRNRKRAQSQCRHLETSLGGALIYTKTAILNKKRLQFYSTLGNDELYITRNLDTDALSTTFPFSLT
jgi:hypothetical protein